MANKKTKNPYAGMTHNQRKAEKRRQERLRQEQEEFKRDLDFCYNMETSRTWRNAWKTTTYLACKERN